MKTNTDARDRAETKSIESDALEMLLFWSTHMKDATEEQLARYRVAYDHCEAWTRKGYIFTGQHRGTET